MRRLAGESGSLAAPCSERSDAEASKTELKTDIGKLFLANSITLTPGTLTMDVRGEYLFIHWINVKDEDIEIEKASKLIGGRFEKHLKAICE